MWSRIVASFMVPCQPVGNAFRDMVCLSLTDSTAADPVLKSEPRGRAVPARSATGYACRSRRADVSGERRSVVDDRLHAMIESFRIRGFRSLANVKATALPPVAVLIGANGPGKSSRCVGLDQVICSGPGPGCDGAAATRSRGVLAVDRAGLLARTVVDQEPAGGRPVSRLGTHARGHQRRQHDRAEQADSRRASGLSKTAARPLDRRGHRAGDAACGVPALLGTGWLAWSGWAGDGEHLSSCAGVAPNAGTPAARWTARCLTPA